MATPTGSPHRLLVLRHAKSSRNNAALADHDRPLASRGPAARSARRAATIRALALGDPVDRPRLLNLLAWADRITLLEKLREGGSRAFHDLVLKSFGQVREGDVRVDGLNVAQQLVR